MSYELLLIGVVLFNDKILIIKGVSDDVIKTIIATIIQNLLTLNLLFLPVRQAGITHH